MKEESGTTHGVIDRGPKRATTLDLAYDDVPDRGSSFWFNAREKKVLPPIPRLGRGLVRGMGGEEEVTGPLPTTEEAELA